MTKAQNFLRDAKVHEVVGGVFGWVWILGTLVGIGWIVAAAVGDASWLIGIAVFLGAQFAKAVAREYNRAEQKAIADGVAAGETFIDAGGHARPLNSGDRASSRAAIDSAFSWADNLVDQYAALLEHQTKSPYFWEGALPANKEDVKQALLIVATVRRGRGQISDDDLRIYKQAYTCLMYAISDERAAALESAMNSIASAGGTSNLSDAEIRDVARHIASAHQPPDVDQDVPMAAVLPAEFDTRLTALLTTYTEGAA